MSTCTHHDSACVTDHAANSIVSLLNAVQQIPQLATKGQTKQVVADLTESVRILSNHCKMFEALDNSARNKQEKDILRREIAAELAKIGSLSTDLAATMSEVQRSLDEPSNRTLYKLIFSLRNSIKINVETLDFAVEHTLAQEKGG